MKQLILLGLIALAIGMGVRMATVKSHAPAAQTLSSSLPLLATDQPPPLAAPGSRQPRWVPIWTRRTPNLRDLSLAPDGQTIAWVDQSGTVRRMSAATGATIWQSTPVTGVNGVVAATGGSVLAFSRLNPLDADVHLFDATNAASAAAPRVSTLPVVGAIWSVIVSPAGDRAYIGTGHSLLFTLPLGMPTRKPPAGAIIPSVVSDKRKASAIPLPPPTPLPMQPIPTQGIPETLAASGARGVGVAAIVAGTWQDAGIRAWSADGTSLWPLHDDPRPDRTYDVQVSADGLTVVAVSSRKPRGGEPRIHVWEGRTGRLIWSQTLDATDVHAFVSAHGNVIALSYVESTPDTTNGGQPGQFAVTHKLALFNRTGNRLIPDMGGRYFAPQLVALSADGQDVTVRDDTGSLRILAANGKILSHTMLPPDPKTGRAPAIRATYTSADGRYLLLQRDDDQITLLKIAAS